MAKGNINVSVENIFPLIKKFLYSDHEIFLRELISNATDATIKLKHLIAVGQANVKNDDDFKIEVKINKDLKTLHVLDQGIGMTEEEVQKYINDIAFSGAEEFLSKYKDTSQDMGIIGHFGLGFYASFMVAKKVQIITKSYTDAPAVIWECDGSPQFSIEKHGKQEQGTEIILFIDKDSEEFLEESRIRTLLQKYNKFMPIPIKLGTKTETKKIGEGDDAKEEKIEVDYIVNNPNPAWTKQPTELKDEDYLAFYRELYPMQFEEPMFHIHLNVDYPFHLTGILYFPKLQNNINLQQDKIQLYQNQVFVTDNVEGIVPDFLRLLRGVIDSPDIPLNVSRSYLQADGNVKKIAGYITKKVGDKIAELFKKEREDFQKKWNDIKVVIEYGMLTDDKFFEKAESFMLYPTVDDKYLTFDELQNRVKEKQTDKDGNLVLLYTNDKEEQHSYIVDAQERGYEILLLDSPIIVHLIQKMETKKENLSFTRVDADHIDNLIKKEDAKASSLKEEDKEKLKKILEENIPKDKYIIQIEAIDTKTPFKITQPEFMRRMRDMQEAGGGGFMGMGAKLEIYNLVVNAKHQIVNEILATKDKGVQKDLITQSLDLARLSQGLLKGEDLTNFINRSYKILSNS